MAAVSLAGRGPRLNDAIMDSRVARRTTPPHRHARMLVRPVIAANTETNRIAMVCATDVEGRRSGAKPERAEC